MIWAPSRVPRSLCLQWTHCLYLWGIASLLNWTDNFNRKRNRFFCALNCRHLLPKRSINIDWTQHIINDRYDKFGSCIQLLKPTVINWDSFLNYKSFQQKKRNFMQISSQSIERSKWVFSLPIKSLIIGTERNLWVNSNNRIVEIVGKLVMQNWFLDFWIILLSFGT